MAMCLVGLPQDHGLADLVLFVTITHGYFWYGVLERINNKSGESEIHTKQYIAAQDTVRRLAAAEATTFIYPIIAMEIQHQFQTWAIRTPVGWILQFQSD